MTHHTSTAVSFSFRSAASGPLAFVLLFACLLSLAFAPRASAQSFVHPGLLHTEADFNRMKTKVDQGAEPWVSGWNALIWDGYSQLGATPRATAEVIRPGNVAQMYIDIYRTYQCALRWKVSGDTRYADQAVTFLNAWSSTMTTLTGSADRFLAAGIHGYQWANIGEIMRTYPGWAEADRVRFQGMLLNIFYPLNESFLYGRNGGKDHNGAAITNYWSNWDLCNMASALAIGVFCDRQDIYDRAMNYIYLGAGNGALDRVIYQLHDGNLGQMQESGRDQGHTTLSLSLLGVICEMAWNQGVDLYGYRNNRVLSAAEYVTRYNAGHDVPYVPYMWGTGVNGDWQAQWNVSSYGRPSHRPMAEMLYNHYVNRMGLAAPFTKAEAEYGRAEGSGGNGDQLGFGTLTFTREPIAQGANPKLTIVQRAGDAVLSWWGSAYATSYNIKRSTTPGGPYVTIAAGVTGITNAYTDPALPSPGHYYYVVTGVLPSGQETGPSNEARAAFPAELTTWLKADETAGTTATDSSGGGHDGTLLNGPAWVAGKTGNAIALDGVDDHASLPADVVGSLSDFTIATWVYLDDIRTWSRIFDFGGKPGSYMFLTPRSNTGGTRFTISTVYNYNEQYVEVPVLPTNQWVHVAVTLSDRVATLYVNGIAGGRKLDCFLQPLQLGNTPQNWIGRSQFSNDAYLKGKIDDFRIYGYALRGSEVHALGAQGANRAPAFVGERVSLVAASEDANYSASAQSLATVASDPDGTTPTFTKLEGPSWLTVASNGALSGTPTNTDVGPNTFLVRVADASGAGEIARLEIDVANTNDAPAWSSDPLVKPAVSQNVAYSGTLAGSASDADVGSTVAFSKISGPAWLSVAADGALTGTPSASDIGVNSFVVRATDDTGASTDVTLNISVLGDVLVARYLLDGSADDTQGGAALTISGTANYVPGATGQALVFDGSSNFANVAIPSPVIYKDFTFAAWVWWDGGAIWQRIFDFGNGTGEYMFLSPAGGSGMRFAIKENGIEQTLDTPALPTGTWVHVTVTLGGNTATIYVNGVAVATSNAITHDPTNINLAANYLGKSQWPDPLFSGKLDDVRLYNHALGASSVSALVHGIPPITPSGLAAAPLSNKVTLTWKTSANAQSYTVKRATTNGGPYTTIATNLTATTYVDTSVVSGATYYYVVTSVNTQGESANSAAVSAAVSDLLVHLKLDEAAGSTAADSSGNGTHGTLVNSPAWTPGFLANAVNLPGTASQHVTLPAGVVSPLSDYTISLWVRIGAFASNSRILDFGTSATPGASTGAYMFLTPQYTTSGGNAAKMRFAVTNAGWNNEKAIVSSTALVAGAWAHVAITRSGNTGSLYLNGALVGTNTAMTISPSALGSTTRNYLGRSQFSADPYLNGAIDDFRIYSRALTEGELSALGQPAADAPTQLAAVPDDGQVVLTWSPNATSTHTVKRATISGGPYATIASGLAAATYTDTGLTNGVTYYYVVGGANSQGAGPDSAEVSVTPSTLRVHYKFDETGGALAADSSGRGLGATLVNAPDFAAGRIDNALSLVSTASQYATLPAAAAQGLTSVTIMTWVRPATVTNFARVFDFGTSTVPTNSTTGAYMFLAPNHNGVLRFAITASGYSNEQQIPGSAPLPAGAWSHVAVTLNGSVGRLYLNGAQVGINSSMTLTPAALGTLANLYLGKSQFSGDPYLNGALDDFRIYGQALSAAEIAPYASPLSAPQNLAATPGPLSLNLAWSAVANATRYTVKYATTSGGPYLTLSSGLSSPGQLHSGLTYGTTYYYVVSAGNSVYESPASAELAATPASALIGEAESATPAFAITPASGGGGATATLTTATSAAGHTYQLQTTTDLAAGSWFDVGDPVAGTGTPLVFETPYDPAELRRFYRVLITR
jgi:hypothetical protein